MLQAHSSQQSPRIPCFGWASVISSGKRHGLLQICCEKKLAVLGSGCTTPVRKCTAIIFYWVYFESSLIWSCYNWKSNKVNFFCLCWQGWQHLNMNVLAILHFEFFLRTMILQHPTLKEGTPRIWCPSYHSCRHFVAINKPLPEFCLDHQVKWSTLGQNISPGKAFSLSMWSPVIFHQGLRSILHSLLYTSLLVHGWPYLQQ